MKLYQHYSLYGFANSYLIGDDVTKRAFIVDPGEFNTGVLNHIEHNDLYVKAILITHNHFHHVRGLKTLLKIYEAEVYAATANVFGFPCRVVRDGDIFEAAGFHIEAISVPGHTPDSMVYRVDRLLFTGDALHAGLIGHTLSPFNTRLLVGKLKEKILTLDDDFMVLPGHGPPSTIGTERVSNIGFEDGYQEKTTTPYDFFV